MLLLVLWTPVWLSSQGPQAARLAPLVYKVWTNQDMGDRDGGSLVLWDDSALRLGLGIIHSGPSGAQGTSLGTAKFKRAPLFIRVQRSRSGHRLRPGSRFSP